MPTRGSNPLHLPARPGRPGAALKVDKRQPSRRLAAIVFTDIVDCSAVVHRGELLGERLLNRQKPVVRAVLRGHDGHEIKTAGDSFLIEFGSALSAVQAVIEIQKTLAAENAKAPKDPPVVLRASIYLGDIEHRDADVYGDGINIAARLLPLSPEGGLALSGSVLALVRQRFDLPLRSLGTPPLKNISHPVEVFVVDAEALQASAPPPAALAPAFSHKNSRSAIAIVMIIAMVLVGAAYWTRTQPASSAPSPLFTSGGIVGELPTRALTEQASIAVLPLVNQSGDPQYEYFSDGLTEELISALALAHVRELRVIGRGSSFQFKGRPTDSRIVGEMLKVSHLLEGSVRKQGGRVRVIARLVNVSDGSQVWTQTFDRQLKDIFAMQTEIADAVASALMLRLLSDAGNRTPANPDLDAYNALLLGNYYYERNDSENWRKAIGYYGEAVKDDPNYALAYAKLGVTWGHLAGNYLAGKEAGVAYVEARRAAQRALVLDPNLAEGHAALGWVLMIADLDLMGAERELRRAVTLAPTEASPKHRLAFVLSCMGRTEEAMALLKQASVLDPLSFRGYYYLSLFLTARGHYEEADKAVRKALELQPTAATHYQQLAVIDVKRGRPDAALLDSLREPDEYWRDYAVALARQDLGDHSAADAALRDFTSNHAEDGAFQIATLHALRGEPDAAFEWLDKAYAARDPAITGLLMDPFLLVYRSDPRFAAFCRRAHIPEA